jgi:cytochrome c-type biogenesis protein CcmH
VSWFVTATTMFFWGFGVDTAHLDASQEKMAQHLGQILRCPVCQGMPIGESPTPMAQSMMHVVREKIAANQSEEDIKRYFMDRYGQWIILDPAMNNVTLFLWLLPPLVLVSSSFLCYWTWRLKWTEHSSNQSDSLYL